MEPQKMRKCLKLLTLLISTILIAAASAQLYGEMYMDATVTVGGAKTLVWEAGVDASEAGTTIDGPTCTLDSLDEGLAGLTYPYSDPVGLSNIDLINLHTFDLIIQDCSGSGTAELDLIEVKLYETDTLKHTLTVWNGAQGSDLTDLSIPADTVWRFQWEITWNTEATAGNTVSVSLVLVFKS